MGKLGYGQERLIGEIIKSGWNVDDYSKVKFNYRDVLFILQEMLEEEGKQYISSDNTNRGHHIFKKFAKHLLYRNIANFDSMVLMTSEKGTGKCIYIKDDKDFVVSANGELVHPKDAKEIVFMDDNMKLKTGKVKKRFQRPEKEVFEVTLRSGKRICLTKEHPLFTINGWKELKDLSVGNFIATPRTYNLNNNKDMNKGLVKLLAYLISDRFMDGRRLEFIKYDIQLREDFKKSLAQYDKNLSLVLPNRIINKNKNKTKNTTNTGGFDSNNTLMNYLKNIGLYGKRSENKSIPNEIMVLKNELISLFLNRLYSCDGGVEIGEQRSYPQKIYYNSKSELMCRQLQHLLLRFNIVAGLSSRLKKPIGTKNNTGTIYWQLFISGKENLINFYKNIGFFHIEKQEKLKIVYDVACSIKSNTNVDVIPYGVLSEYNFKVSSKKYADLFDAESVTLSALKKFNLSLLKFKQIADAEQDDKLLKLANSDIFWDRIISIEQLKTEEVTVYDLEIDDPTHNFVCNDIIVHNSSAAIMLGREWCKLLGIRFDPDRHLAYNNRDVMEKIDSLQPFEPLICDEAVRFASSSDWAKSESKELKKKLAEVRTKHLLFVLCFPLKINKIEKNYLESFVNYWCVTGDTKIITRDKTGIIRNTPIKKLNKYNSEVLSYNINTKEYEFKTYEKKILTKKNAEIFELELVNGLKIKCTADHPFLTQRGWIRLKDLKETDKIEVKTKTCKYCNKVFISNHNKEYCSKKCNYSYNRHGGNISQHEKNKKYEKKCEYCGNIFIVDKSNSGHKNKKFCSFKCRNQKYNLENKELIKNINSKYNKSKKGKLKNKKYAKKNRRVMMDRFVERYNTDEQFNIAIKFRRRIYMAIKNKYTKKATTTIELLGCSYEEFKKHISKQFTKGMTWKKFLSSEIHLDHIKPCSHFDLTKESEQKECFNYKNQQPMWAKDNLSKGDRYVG